MGGARCAVVYGRSALSAGIDRGLGGTGGEDAAKFWCSQRYEPASLRSNRSLDPGSKAVRLTLPSVSQGMDLRRQTAARVAHTAIRVAFFEFAAC